jgi:hypothetical protein
MKSLGAVLSRSSWFPIVKWILCVALVMMLGGTVMYGQSHVAEPTVNLGDTSFLDGVAGPGIVVEQIGDGAHDGRIANAQGNTVSDASSVNSISGLTHIAWLIHRQVFGGWYGTEVVIAAAHVNSGALGQTGGFGDITVSPFILQWPEKRILGMPIDQRVVTDFDLPVGEYSQSSIVNLSSHAFTVHPYYAITAFPKKRIETSWRVHYLWNSTNDSPPIGTGAKVTQAGEAIHFNATDAYNLCKDLWIGPNGYYIKQITMERSMGCPFSTHPNKWVRSVQEWSGVAESGLSLPMVIRSLERKTARLVISSCCESKRSSSELILHRETYTNQNTPATAGGLTHLVY